MLKREGCVLRDAGTPNARRCANAHGSCYISLAIVIHRRACLQDWAEAVAQRATVARQRRHAAQLQVRGGRGGGCRGEAGKLGRAWRYAMRRAAHSLAPLRPLLTPAADPQAIAAFAALRLRRCNLCMPTSHPLYPPLPPRTQHTLRDPPPSPPPNQSTC
jgi:hypothetical protein